MYLIDPPPYRPPIAIFDHCLPTSASQGELYIIDGNNEINFLPCGDLCGEDVDIPTDDDPVSYTYLGCYADNRDRIFSGNFIQEYAKMTTEVSRTWV